MRILKRDIIDKNGQGKMKLIAEEAEDMWHLYNLIAVNDIITSHTSRNVSSALCSFELILFRLYMKV